MSAYEVAVAMNASSSRSPASWTIAATGAPSSLTSLTHRPDPLRRWHERLAAGVDPPVLIAVEPVDDLDRRVVERVGERRAQLLRLGLAGQLGGQALHRARHEQPPAERPTRKATAMAGSASETSHRRDLDEPGVDVEPAGEDGHAERRHAEDGHGQDGLERAPHDGLAARSRAPSRHVAATISAMTSTSRSG